MSIFLQKSFEKYISKKSRKILGLNCKNPRNEILKRRFLKSPYLNQLEIINYDIKITNMLIIDNKMVLN